MADCADLDDDGIRDDICTWWECVEGTCMSTPIGFSDLGGQFGDCLVDGATDGNDFNHALNCFANRDVDGNLGYPCATHPDGPPRAYNVDGSGQFGSCIPDGVCDGNDARSALRTFNGEVLCTCPLDGGAPAPEVDDTVRVVASADITLVAAQRRIRPRDTVAIDVLVDGDLKDLQGYQLHVEATGGRRGTFELVDISVERHRQAVFSGMITWNAYNVDTGQMVAGLYDDGIATPPGGYLATFTFRASADATGAFVIDLLADDSDDTQRSYLFPTGSHRKIAIEHTTAAVIAVSANRK